MTEEQKRQAKVGIALSVVGYFFFCVHDAIIKWLVTSISVFQVLLFRSFFILLIMLAIGRGRALLGVARSPVKWQLIGRGFIVLSAWLLYYSAAKKLQLAELVTLYFAAPLVVAALSAWLLKEKVSPQRWLAVGLGFSGVLVAAQPGGNSDPLSVAMALGAALMWGYGVILIRRLSAQVPTLVNLIYNNAFFVVAMGLVMPWVWVWPTEEQWIWVIALGFVGALAQGAVFEGLRRAEASLLAPFEFTSLIWPFVIGYIVFDDQPATAVYAGAALILFSGGYALWAERRAQAASSTV